MNKKELIAAAADRANMPAAAVTRAYDAILEVLVDEVIKGGIRVDSFGTFKVVETAAREARNPKTGEVVKVPARKAVKFSAAQALKDKVQ